MATVREHIELPQAVESLLKARTADAVLVVGPNYRIVYWDAQAESLTGFLSEEVVGKPCYEVIIGEDERGFPFCTHNCPVMGLAQACCPVSSYEMYVCTRWGKKRWVNVSILSIDSDEGPYLVHLLRDSQKAYETLEMARRLIELSSEEKKPSLKQRGAPELTPRQSEVLKLLSEGKSAKEIGKELYLSQSTVRNHIRALLQALGACSQLEALAKAREMGLLY